ncbi:hypothetical protein CsNV_046 [Callinectes sapidus nudivirus]|nr:hypothetical protein CsNV_046 [Callinectes sapidus nudivirus]
MEKVHRIFTLMKNVKPQIIITDVFNVFTIPDEKYSKFDIFNFIIEDADIVAKKIMSGSFNNINLNNSTLKKIYVNLKNPTTTETILYIRPPDLKKIQTMDYVKIFNYPYKQIIINDTKTESRAILNMVTIDSPDFDKIWEYNPGLTRTQNVDILMQKLFGDDINVTTKTYNELLGDILNYKQFRIINVKKQGNVKINECEILNHHDIYGFDLTTIWN